MIEIIRRVVRWRWPLILAIFLPAGLAGAAWVEAQPPVADAVSVVGVSPSEIEFASPDLIRLTINRLAVTLSSPGGLEAVSEETDVPVADLEDGLAVVASADSANLRIETTFESEAVALEVADAVAVRATELGDPSGLTTVEVLADAVVEAAPLTSSPRVLQAIVLLVALVAAFGVASLLEVLRPRIRTGGDAEAATGSIVLAGLRTFPTSGRRAISDEEVLVAARDLRSGLVATERASAPGPVCVIGSERGAGGSTVAFLLARSAADAGERVVIIDADLHHAGLSQRLGLPRDVGLDDVLAGRADLDEAVVHEGGVPVVGTHRSIGTDAVVERRFSKILGDLGQSWERVIVDAPSVGSEGSDVVALEAASSLLVVSLGASVVKVSRAARRLERLGVPVRGVVLNRASRSVADSMRTPVSARSHDA